MISIRKMDIVMDLFMLYWLVFLLIYNILFSKNPPLAPRCGGAGSPGRGFTP
jgi:hypothetical protein